MDCETELEQTRTALAKVQADLDTILVEWDKLVDISQTLTDPELIQAEQVLDTVMKTVAVSYNHPDGMPRRRP